MLLSLELRYRVNLEKCSKNLQNINYFETNSCFQEVNYCETEGVHIKLCEGIFWAAIEILTCDKEKCDVFQV